MQQALQKPVEEQLREQLIEEAKEAHRLLTQSDQKYRKQADIKKCYIISRNWFNQWSEYVGYLEILADLEPESEKFATVKPNKQINEEFISQQNDKSLTANKQLFKFDENNIEESCYLNNINTFKIVDEQTWKFFSARYPGGFEIQRPVFHYQNRIIQNIQLLQISIKLLLTGYIQIDIKQEKDCIFSSKIGQYYFYQIFFQYQPDIIILNDELVESLNKLSDMQLKNSNNVLNVKKCQFPSYYNLSQFKELLKRQFQVNNLKVWMLDASQKREDIYFQTSKSIKQKNYQVRANELSELKVGKLILQDLIKNHYCLIIELPQRGKFELKQQNQNQITNGKFTGICEYCTKLLDLNVRCVCKEVVYCSQNCKYKDQDFHSHSCEVAADSESDEEMDFLPLEISGKAGLKNIGNTCYIAAALQNVYVSKEFSQKFTMNEVQKIPNKRCKLLQKFSKLLKEMSMQNEESIEPWSFKTQLGLINQMFSGNYQHDAAEFITCLIDALNEECQKEPQKNGNKNIDLSKPDQFWEFVVKQGYNKAAVESFLGLYESSIECPDCYTVSNNYDPFSILSLPIKQKPIVKQIMVNFIKFNILEEVRQIRTTYTTGKTTIIDLIQQVCKESEMVYNNNIVACTYNGESIQQSYIIPEQLEKTVEELEAELEGKNKSLIFYEINFDTSKFNPLQHKIIKLDFARIGKIQIGIMQVDEKTIFSAPRIIIVERSQNLSSIYIQLFETVKEIYPEAFDQIKESFQEFKEIKSEIDLEQSNTQAVEKVKNDEERKNEDRKWNGPQPDSPIKAINQQSNNQVQQADQKKTSAQSSSQNISPPKQEKNNQINQQSNAATDGWDDYDIPVFTLTQKQTKEQKQQNKSNIVQTQSSSKTQQEKQYTQQQENKNGNKTSSSQSLVFTQANTDESLINTNVQQNNSSATQNNTTQQSDGWGWDSEIVAIPKKTVPPVQKPASTQQSTQQLSQQQPQKVEDEFTQVTSNKKPNRQNNNKINEQQFDNSVNNNKYYDKNNKNNYNNKNQQKPSEQQLKPVVNSNNQIKQLNTNQNQSKVTAKQQPINQFSGWGDEDLTPAIQTQTQAPQQSQVIEKQQNQEPKQKIHQIEQQTNNQNKSGQKVKQQQKEDFSELLSKLPFSVNIKSKRRRIGGVFKCFFCGKQNCQNCTLPYENQKNLQQLLQTYRDLFELELNWTKDQPSKNLFKTIIDQYQANSQAKKSNLPTLSYCLQEFSQKEQLSTENQWFCAKCKKDQQAFKRLSIKYAPNNLIIQIKRFKTNILDGSKEKNYQQVVFPENNFSLSIDDNIQASPSIDNKNSKLIYDLYGVIVHEGTTENGHYIAHCKYDKLWYSFDDDNITIIDSDKVVNNKNAYILFYRLKK